MWWIFVFLVALLALGLVIVIGFVIAYFRSGDFRSYLKLLDGENVPIARLDENQACKILGVVHCLGEPLRAPLSNRECAFYEVGIERRVRVENSTSGPDRYRWEGRDCETVSSDFLLEDSTGVARIDVSRSYFQAQVDHFVHSGASPEADAKIERFVDMYDLDRWRAHLAKGQRVRLREAVIEPRETVVAYGVVGAAEPHRDPRRAGLRETPMRAVLYGSEKQPVAISDDPDLTHTAQPGA